MTSYQQVKFAFIGQDGQNIGDMRLRATYHGPIQGDVKEEYIKCKNVPKLNYPTDKFPIEYCKFNTQHGLSKIMLLEETSYDVIFEANDESEVTCFLPEIEKKVFNKNLFNEKKYTRVGTLNFGSYVGRAYFSVEVGGIKSLPIDIEVRSKKIGYASDYALMMADLSEDCSALIYDLRSPVHQPFEISQVDRRTLYEDYLYLEYLFKEQNLPAAYKRIKDSPKALLVNEKELSPLSTIQSFETEDLLDMVSMPQLLTSAENPPRNWPSAMKNYIPLEIWETQPVETTDIPENRFVKYFIEQVFELLEKIKSEYKYNGYIKDRIQVFHEQISDYLSHEWLKDIGPLTSIPMNSQLLQKRGGYRDIFSFHLNFEFAFRFSWTDIEDNLDAAEKRMSQLYEYWCYFRFIDAIKKVAKVATDETGLVELKEDGWAIRLKHGQKSKVKFIFKDNHDTEHIFELYYNRGFSSRGKPESRSYSLPFRPDYTLVYKSDNKFPIYLHFDAKYRSQKDLEDFSFKERAVENSEESVDLTTNEKKHLEEIEEQEIGRKYKNADIYKMHTYKDGIINSLGAYVFYPGHKLGVFKEDGDYFMPSIGAIPLKPGNSNQAFFMKVEKILCTFAVVS